MQIIIPMSGIGDRFIKAGYTDPKPLIQVNNRPIIEYVVNLFPGGNEFIFICNLDHLTNTNMREVLRSVCPNGKVVGIPPHKLGPVYAVQQIYDYLKDDSPGIVNYCDYYMAWDFFDFERIVNETNCDGAIPCYTGFHPHLLPISNVYAGCKVKGSYLTEIREKFSYSSDKTLGLHSAGTYYFRTGEILKKYFSRAISENLNLNGEFYVSLVFNALISDGLKVLVYDKIPYFCQWGTPQDLEDFLYWQGIFTKRSQ